MERIANPILPTLIAFLAVVGLISAVTAIMTGCEIWSEAAPKPARLELFKVSLQVLLIVVLGTTASVLVAELNRNRDSLIKSQAEARQKLESRRERARLRSEARRERGRQELEAVAQYQRTLMERLTHAYSESKKARRLLRARALRSTDTALLVRAAEYDQLMQELNEVQLDLEEVCKELEN